MPWAMVFPHVDETPRHPSHLYLLPKVFFIVCYFVDLCTKTRADGRALPICDALCRNEIFNGVCA
ncbi:MAG: hypothetical protein ACNYNY_02380 [Candidatus Oxydemutatoraceae bacterium WSBS_2016_MAG_OTU14]